AVLLDMGATRRVALIPAGPSEPPKGCKEAAMKAITGEEVIASATAMTGLSDFGSDAFREGLERTLAGFAEAPLTPASYAAAVAQVAGHLANRLRVEEWSRAHPEVDAQAVEGPLVVLGLPRSGTTATVDMFALDPTFRFLRGWEGRSPVPPPEAGREDEDPR